MLSGFGGNIWETKTSNRWIAGNLTWRIHGFNLEKCDEKVANAIITIYMNPHTRYVVYVNIYIYIKLYIYIYTYMSRMYEAQTSSNIYLPYLPHSCLESLEYHEIPKQNTSKQNEKPIHQLPNAAAQDRACLSGKIAFSDSSGWNWLDSELHQQHLPSGNWT